jgi:hypothetical protein
MGMVHAAMFDARLQMLASGLVSITASPRALERIWGIRSLTLL